MLFALQDATNALGLEFGIGKGIHAEQDDVSAFGEAPKAIYSVLGSKMVRVIVC